MLNNFSLPSAGNSTGDLGSLVRLPTELLQRIWALSVKRGNQEPVTDWNKWLYASIGMRRQVTAACRCNNLAAMAASRMWSCPEVHFSEAAAEYVLSLRKCDPGDLLKDDFEEVAAQVGFRFPAVTDLDNGVAIQHHWDRNYLDNLNVFGEPQPTFCVPAAATYHHPVLQPLTGLPKRLSILTSCVNSSVCMLGSAFASLIHCLLAASTSQNLILLPSGRDGTAVDVAILPLGEKCSSRLTASFNISFAIYRPAFQCW